MNHVAGRLKAMHADGKEQEYKARCKTLNDDTINIVEKASPEYDPEAMAKPRDWWIHTGRMRL